MMFNRTMRTDYSVETLQQLFKQIREKFSFSEDQYRSFASWLREKSGMGEALNQMQDELRNELRIDGRTITPVFSRNDSDDVYLKAMRAAFRICDDVLGNPESITLIEFPADIQFDDFMKLVEQLNDGYS